MATIDVPFATNISKPPLTCAVLGGRSFLGRPLVSRLLQLGSWIVRVADSSDSLSLDSSDSLLYDAVSSSRASLHSLDVLSVSQITQAIGNASVVFYVESGDLRSYGFYHCYMIVVQGAKNVINACRQSKVRKLVYNSTADVIFDGSCDICNGDEFLPCNWRFDDVLSDLKAQAEALILYANNIDGLLTCALRPSNVFGPGDPQLVPFLLNLAKSGLAKFIIGNGENLSDFTYSENVVHSLLCAAEALDSQMVFVAGKAFFITNLEPVKFWDFVSSVLEGLGYQRPLIKLSAGICWHVLEIIRWTQEKLGFKRFNISLSTHFFHLASRGRTFNCSAAQKHIGYSPIVSLEDGITSTIESFSHLASNSSLTKHNLDKQSKADKFLGGGKVSEILLWRDEKKTFAYFLAFSLLFYWFLLSGRTFTSSLAKLLLLITTTIYGHGILPSKISGFTIQRMPSSWFEISETAVKLSLRSLVYIWNKGVVHSIRLLAKGEDWANFLRVALSLYLLKSTSLQSLTVAIGMALVFAFTAFFVYEQYESELDGLAKFLLFRIKELNGYLMKNLHVSMASFLPKKEMSDRDYEPASLKDETRFIFSLAQLNDTEVIRNQLDCLGN